MHLGFQLSYIEGPGCLMSLSILHTHKFLYMYMDGGVA